MKALVDSDSLPPGAVLLLGSSHEERCRGIIANRGKWRPSAAILFHYDDENPRREMNHSRILLDLDAGGVATRVIRFSEGSAVLSLRDNMGKLHEVLDQHRDAPIVLDISVLTKRHLLMTLRWLDDEGYWDRLWVVYCEPTDYDVSQFIPLSFGLRSMQQVPGFSACPDLSRPVHLVLFLGYEGDRARAVYEHIEPLKTTLIIPDPPYHPEWAGRTEAFNKDLMAVVGPGANQRLDAINPEATQAGLRAILGQGSARGVHAKIISPLGTKPQTLGIYCYLRECADPPALVYAGPLRHNHDFFSHGIGPTWLLKMPQ